MQKSTSGAWQRALASDELAKATVSSPLLEGGRKSVGSRAHAAKHEIRWRAHARGFAKARPSGHSAMEGALRRRQRMPLTRCSREAGFGRARLGFGRFGLFDRERQRLTRTPRLWPTTPERRCASSLGSSIGAHQEKGALEHASDDGCNVREFAKAPSCAVKRARTRV